MSRRRRKNPFLLLPLIGVLGLGWNLAADAGWGDANIDLLPGHSPNEISKQEGGLVPGTSEAEAAEKEKKSGGKSATTPSSNSADVQDKTGPKS